LDDKMGQNPLGFYTPGALPEWQSIRNQQTALQRAPDLASGYVSRAASKLKRRLLHGLWLLLSLPNFKARGTA